jgi:hypothetical protein
VDLDSDDRDVWIADLRLRIMCGELVSLPHVDLGNGTRVNADLVARIMVGEFDGLANLSHEEQDCLDHVVNQRSLLWDLPGCVSRLVHVDAGHRTPAIQSGGQP